MTATLTNREAWLNQFAAAARPSITRWLELGGDEESALRISCGYAPNRRTTTAAVLIPPMASEDFTAEAFISPAISDKSEVAAALLPLLVAAYAGDWRKGATYRNGLQRCGLNASTMPRWAADIVEAMPAYPHAKVELDSMPKQTTRLLKAACHGDLMNGEAHAPYIVRLSRATYVLGAPICPLCSSDLTISN
jgi:hypothetical protein